MMNELQFKILLAVLTLIATKIGCSKEDMAMMMEEAGKSTLRGQP